MPIRLPSRLTVLTVTALLMTSAPLIAAAPPAGKKPARPAEPVERIKEMLEWLAWEQQKGNGGFTWRGHVAYEPGKDRFRVKPHPPTAVDTSLVALSILRTASANGRTLADDVLVRAVRFVEREVQSSDPYALKLSKQSSPLMVRIAPHVDTYFALWLLAELAPPLAPSDAPNPLIVKLIGKIEKHANEDGTWGPADAAQNSPLLGHAIGVRALETALRKGYTVDPAMLARAGQYALTDKAKGVDYARNGRWRPDCGGFKPFWLYNDEFVTDFEPINEALYLSAARLCVVDQADRSNFAEEQRIRERLAKPASKAELEELAAGLRTIVTTRKTLAASRAQMLAALGEAKTTKQKTVAPVIFCADDYLAALLIVDAMGAAAAPEWFPQTVRDLMFIQDVDGGVKTPDHIPCRVIPPCQCSRDRRIPSDLCRDQLAFCSRDRVFCTAATLAMLVADTPYRQGFLDKKSVK